MKVIILRGIPGCGKTTWVKEFLKQNKNYIVISRDIIRDMLHDHSNSYKTEMIVTKFYNKLLKEALKNKINIILDNNHAKPKYIIETLAIIEKINPKVDIELKQFDYELEVCIERDSKRERVVGRKVIEKMHQIIQKNPKEKIEKIINEWKANIDNKKNINKKYNDNLQGYVIFDNGTLALKISENKYYDWVEERML